MSTKTLILAGAAVLMLGTAPSFAQTTAPAQPDATAIVANLDPGVAALPYHDFDGMDVQSVNGERIGEIERLYRRDGKMFARMNIGGDWFDIVKEEVVVPLEHFTVVGDELRLPITEAQAEALEEWSDGDYEQMAEDLEYETVGDAYLAD